MKAWRLLFSSDEALKPLVKSSLLISYGDEYVVDHRQKTAQPGALQRRGGAMKWAQSKQHFLPLSS